MTLMIFTSTEVRMFSTVMTESLQLPFNHFRVMQIIYKLYINALVIYKYKKMKVYWVRMDSQK